MSIELFKATFKKYEDVFKKYHEHVDAIKDLSKEIQQVATMNFDECTNAKLKVMLEKYQSNIDEINEGYFNVLREIERSDRYYPMYPDDWKTEFNLDEEYNIPNADELLKRKQIEEADALEEKVEEDY